MPHVPSDPLVPHETWSGEPTILKGIAKEAVNATYYWEFGDGNVSESAPVTNPDDLSATHSYSAPPDTLFIARLHVLNGTGEESTDEYRVLVKAKTLDIEINKAIDDALWWLYTNKEAAVDSYTIIPPEAFSTADGEEGLTGQYFNNITLSGDPAVERTDPNIDFVWSYSSPGTGINPDFSARWTGTIHIPQDGYYAFASCNDDGTRLYIDGLTLIDDWTDHGATWIYSPIVYLTAGPHTFQVDFYDLRYAAQARIYWAQNPAIRWQNFNTSNRYTTYTGNPTASAVQAFEINGHMENGDPEKDPYVLAVKGGLSYLFSNLTAVNMTLQGENNPDSNLNGIGLTWSRDNRPIYELGAIMDAIVATGTPDAIATVGGANVLGRRYQDIVQDMVDMYAWGQDDSGGDRGGWRYSWNGGADNSAAQWAAIGMIAAQRHFGCTVPEWVKEQNRLWLDVTYNSTGYFGYTGRSAFRSGYATGPSGMVQMVFDDIDTTDSRWQTCEQYIDSHWESFLGWNYDTSRQTRDGRYYSYYAFAKAMRLALPEEVVYLPSGLNWYGDEEYGLAKLIVDTQNPDGSWPYDGWPYIGPQTAAAWNVIILTRTLFEKPPVAVIKAAPNPGAIGQAITLDASSSYHTDPSKEVVQYLWDFDASDGVDFDHPDATGLRVSTTYGALADYTVSLKVIDNSTPQRFDVSTLTLHITVPPHPPTAVVGGPYIAATGEAIRVDGSGSYDIDQNQGDSIKAWDWESDLVPPYGYDEAHGETADLPPFDQPGRYDIILRVTDNTSTIFPSSNQPDLTDTAFGEVMVYTVGVDDLAARPKDTKCQLTWTPTEAEAYKILRSEQGPNQGFVQIGTTTSDYSVFIDHNLATTTGEMVNTCKGDLNQDNVVDDLDAVIFASELGTSECTENNPCRCDFDNDGDVDGTDNAFFLAEMGRDQCQQVTGLEIGKDYWYRIMTEVNGVTRISRPVYVNSQGRIINNPPVITSTPQTEAEDSVQYRYDVNAYDPEGTTLEYLLEIAPSGMSIDPDSGLIVWMPTQDQIGIHDVMVRVQDIAGISTTQYFQITVSPRPNTAPAVDTGGPYRALTGQEITFSGTATDPENDTITSWHWSFGDGTEAEGRQVTHTYTAAGTFTVALFVTDERGATGHGETSCQVEQPNTLPVADAGGPYYGFAGTPVEFDGSNSYDADNDQLTYTWNFGDSTPAETGMQVTHTYAAPGTYTVYLSVNDGRGGIDTDSVQIDIAPPNQAPVFEPDPVSIDGDLVNGAVLTLTAQVYDPEGDSLTYNWDFGDSFSANGNPVTHAFESPGEYTVTISVSDAWGATTSASKTVIITEAPNRPPVADAGGPYQGDLNGAATVTVTLSAAGSSDPDNNIATYTWIANGQQYSGETVDISFDSVGTHEITLYVTDEDGETDSDTTTVEIYDSQDVNPPSVTITTPGTGDTEVTEKMQVIGSVSDPENHIAYWFLEISDHKDLAGEYTDWTVISQGSSPVSDGVLGILDPTRLRNNFYRLRLRASDGNHETTYWIDISVAGNLKLGNLKLTFKDLEIPVAGIPIIITRTYDSFKKDKGDFGYGWTLDINNAEIKEDSNHNVLITLPDGRRVVFGFAPVKLSPWIPGWNVTFIAPPGVHDELDFVGDHTVNYSNGEWYWGTGVFNPDDYILKTRNGQVYEINQQTGIKKVTDRNGNYLTIDQDGITHSSGKKVTFVRDQEGRIAKIIDPAGNCIDYTFDESGDLTRVTYPEGYEMRFQYDQHHFITQIIDPENRAVQKNEYDSEGRLVAVTDDEGVVTTFEHDVDNRIERAVDGRGNPHEARFDTNGLKTEEIDAMGNRKLWTYDNDQNVTRYEVRNSAGNLLQLMTFEYDERGNPLTITLPDGTSTRFTYNEAGKWTSVTLPDGRSMSFTYDDRYNLTHMTDTMGHGFSYTYDSAGNRTSAVDPLGRTTRYSYDGYGNIIEVVDHCGRTHSYLRNDFGKVLKYVRPDGGTFTNEYDSMGRLIHTTDPAGNELSFRYDSRGNLTAETDQSGNTTSYTYNSHSKLTHVRYPDGSEIRVTYDANGNMIAVTDTRGNVWHYEYDAADRLTTQIDPLGNRYTFEYNGAGFVTAVTDPLGNRTVYERDPFGRIARIIDPMGGITSYSYNIAGDLTQITDALGHTRRWEYDDLYHMVADILPGGQTTRYVYDAAGRRIQRTDATGQTTVYSYDTCDNLLEISYPDSSRINFTYDINGNRTSMTDGTGTTTYSYDILNQLTSVTRPDGATISYAYDARGNIVSIEDPAGITHKTYDSMNRITSVTGREDEITTYSYDPSGALSSIVLPNGVTASYSWNSTNRLAGIHYQKTGGIDLEVGYTYDATGNTTRRIIGNSSTDFTYDQIGRLISETGPYGNTTYTYDAVGNRITKTDDTGTITYSYDENHRIVSDTLSFDENGNLISNGTYDFTYDFENRLTGIYQNGLLLIGYTYDGDGNRVAIATDNRDTSLLVDINRELPVTLLETEGSSILASYTYGIGRISMNRQGNHSFYLADALQSVIGLTDTSGILTDSYSMDAFGHALSTSGTTVTPYRFIGAPIDEISGLYHLGAREYDPATGRFLGVDPAMGKVIEPMTFHPYIYGLDNPLKYFDPSGRQALVNYSVTVINNPLQFMGALAAGWGAGYTSTTLNFLSEVMKNVGKPMLEMFANSLIQTFLELNLLDCGQLAISAGIKGGTMGTLLQAGHKAAYYGAKNAATGDWSHSHEQLKSIGVDMAQNIGRLLIRVPNKLTITASGEIAEFGVKGNVFLFFDFGKSIGALTAAANIAYAMGGFL